MPFYEYTCETCGHEFETLARTMDEPAPPCPECAGTTVKRKFSVFGVSAGQAPAPPAGCGGCSNAGSCPMSH